MVPARAKRAPYCFGGRRRSPEDVRSGTPNNFVNRALTTSLHPAADLLAVVEGGVAVMATVLKTLGVVAWAIIVVGYFYPRAMPLPLSPDALAVVGAILIGASVSR